MKWGIRSVAGTAIACLVVGLAAAVAIAAGQTYKASLVRGTGDALRLTVSSSKAISSYSFKLKKTGYKITGARLVKAGGKPVKSSSYYAEACSPAVYQGSFPQEAHSGNGMVCGLSTGLPPGVKSIVIDFTTNRCLPAGAVPDARGPSGACRK
jgi:hypothetical protein